MRILAVDDSPTMLDILSATLSEAGHEVLQARDSAEAVGLLAQNAVSLIISDLNMEGMSGLELLHHVRQSPAHGSTPFLFLTTESEPELKRAARQGGAAAWMQKPFDPEGILHVIGQLARQ